MKRRSLFAAAFGESVALQVTQRHFVFRYRSPSHWVEVFCTTFGPLLKVFETLDTAGRERLVGELRNVVAEFNKGDDGTFVARPNISGNGDDKILIAYNDVLSSDRASP